MENSNKKKFDNVIHINIKKKKLPNNQLVKKDSQGKLEITWT